MRLTGEEIREAFRERVRRSPNPARSGCPGDDALASLAPAGGEHAADNGRRAGEGEQRAGERGPLAGEAGRLAAVGEAARLAIVDHVGACLPCARELAAIRMVREGHLHLAPSLPDRLDATSAEWRRAATTNDGETAAWSASEAGQGAPATAGRGTDEVAGGAAGAARHGARPKGPGFFERLGALVARPAFAVGALATILVGLVAGGLLAHRFARVGAPELVAVAPGERATSANLALAWEPAASATAYDVRMSWKSGKVFYESARVAGTRLEVPATAVAQMKRGQTCFWTLRAYAGDEVVAEKTFSFVVDFDPPPAP